MHRDEIVQQLVKIGSVKFGNFKLKSGIMSPFYIDLRLIISSPKLLKGIGDAMWQTVQSADFDVICGVPYTALPIATQMSLEHDVPMVMRRREVKDHGIKKTIEGVAIPGQKCLIVEDLITSGASIFETVVPVQDVGLKVHDVVVFLDREQGGRQTVEAKGLHFHSVITMTELLESLQNDSSIDKSQLEQALAFIQSNQFTPKKETADV